jgi:hypothetical protein
MADIIPFLQDDAFGPEALRAMSTALAEVCRILKLDHDQSAREAIAFHIIQLARYGERDAERLRDRVLRKAANAHVATSRCSMPPHTLGKAE